MAPKCRVARTYLVKRGFQLVVLQALLDQRDEGMGFDVARKGKTLRIWEPCALQRDSSITMTCLKGKKGDLVRNGMGWDDGAVVVVNPGWPRYEPDS